MPTLAQVRTYVDGKLADLWTLADARQQVYAANNPTGRYWQGRITRRLDLLPDNTLAAPATAEYDTLADDQVYAPTGETDPLTGEPVMEPTLTEDEYVGIAGSHTLGWRGALPSLPAKLPAAFQADEWLSPTGIGWTLTVWVKFNGTVYTRSRTRHEDGSITTTAWETAS